MLGMINTLFCTDRLTTPTTPHSRTTWPRSGRCLGWTDILLTKAPCWKEKPSLQGYPKRLCGFSKHHQGLSEAILTGKGSISDFFPVPPAHHRVTKCDTAREKLLGTIGDLFEVSLALEENIIPEYLTSRTFKNCSYWLSRIYIWNFLFCLV